MKGFVFDSNVTEHCYLGFKGTNGTLVKVMAWRKCAKKAITWNKDNLVHWLTAITYGDMDRLDNSAHVNFNFTVNQ